MSTDLRDLYQQVILDHNRSPRNFKELPEANHSANGDNPLCGDKIAVYVKVSDGVIEDVAFQGTGCAISQSSASLMTSAVKGKTVEEAEELFEAFHDMVTGGTAERRNNGPEDQSSALPPFRRSAVLGKLAAFEGVKEFPARVKCANLAWHTLHAALSEEGSVTTE